MGENQNVEVQNVTEKSPDTEKQNLLLRKLRNSIIGDGKNLKDITGQEHELQKGETLGAIVLAYERAYQKAKKETLGLNWQTKVRRFDKDGKVAKEVPLYKANFTKLGDKISFQKDEKGKLFVTVGLEKAKEKTVNTNVDLFVKPELINADFLKKYEINDADSFKNSLEELKVLWPGNVELGQWTDKKFWDLTGESSMERETRFLKLFERDDGKIQKLWASLSQMNLMYPKLFADSSNPSATKFQEMSFVTNKRLIEFADKFGGGKAQRGFQLGQYHESILSSASFLKNNKSYRNEALNQLVMSSKYLLDSGPADPDQKKEWEKINSEAVAELAKK